MTARAGLASQAAAGAAAFGAYRLYRVYRYGVLPRYSTAKSIVPYPGSPAALNIAPLGRYYADLAAGVRGYPLDEDGVVVLKPGLPSARPVYNPCLVAQYALMTYENVLTGDDARTARVFRRQLDWLAQNATPAAGGGRVLLYHYDTAEERAPWGSAIAQGMAISALLRGYEHFGERSYLELAEQLFTTMDTATSAGGYRFADASYVLWYEEDNREGHILNGHLFALLGVQDLYRATGEERYLQRRDEGLRAVKENLSAFDTGFTTKYRAIDDQPANNSYHHIHAAQFRVWATITGDPFFAVAADRFYGYHRSCRYKALNFAYVLRQAARHKLSSRPGTAA